MARRTLRYETLESRQLLAADAGVIPTDIAAPPAEPVALLLPAVQKVREAAARMNASDAIPEDLGIDSPEPEGILIGLLLPAVQKVREAAAPDEPGLPTDLSSGEGEGLLLPAVQKVREAAARMKCSNNLHDPGDSGEETYLAVELENVQITSYQLGVLDNAAADEFFKQLGLQEQGEAKLGQDGNDLLIYNNGDGSDFSEGGEGFDFVQVNGSNIAGDVDAGDYSVWRSNFGSSI